MIKPKVQRLLMQHGFTIKNDQTDLKPYVYEAVQAVLIEASLTISEIKALLAVYGVDNEQLVFALWGAGREKAGIREYTLDDFWAAVEKSGMTISQLREGMQALEATSGNGKA